jgi:hypothetical protein
MAGGPSAFVNVKFAVPGMPTTLAITEKLPAVPFAVKIGAVARPEASVVAVFAALAKVPLAPLPGCVNVTVVLATGFPLASLTKTANGAANCERIAVL